MQEHNEKVKTQSASLQSQSMVSLLKNYLNGAKHIVEAHIPTVEPLTNIEEDGNFDKFGGLPAIPRISLDDYNKVGQNFDEEAFLADFQEVNCLESLWPTCWTCGIPQTFFFQVTDPRTQITYQMFKCLICECDYHNNNYEVREIEYNKCYSINEIMSGTFKESVFIDDFTERKYEFSKTFLDHYKKAQTNAYDHKISNQEYLSQHFRESDLRDRQKRDNHAVFYRSYRVSKWEIIEESTMSTYDFLKMMYESPLAEKIPPWICQHDKESYKHWTKYSLVKDHFKDYEKNKDEITKKLKGYDCSCFGRYSHHNIKFGGKPPSCQGYSYPNSIFHFADTYYLPYMWGDSGYAHLTKENGHGYSHLKVEFDCC